MIAPWEGMDNRSLHRLIEGMADIIDGHPGFWHIRYIQRDLWIIADEEHDRLRVMTPIVEEDELLEEDYRLLLSANFDRALDAKYAVAQGCLWSVFVHPLRSLSERLFCSAMEQVHKLADNYGTSYSSTDIIFNCGDESCDVD